MIDFTCNHCGKRFSVPDDFAGRKGKCKSCGALMLVPVDASATDAPDPGGVTTAVASPARAARRALRKLPPRTRRLFADQKHVQEYLENHQYIQLISAEGDPAERYRIRYKVQGLELDPKGQPRGRNVHEIEIIMPLDYPRLAPVCRMLTPIFHPNIDDHTICVGDHWVAGEALSDLIVRIGQMITYQAYNIRSPLNAEAAMWADLHARSLPVDNRDLYLPEPTPDMM